MNTLTALSMRSCTSWDSMPLRPVKSTDISRKISPLHLQDQRESQARNQHEARDIFLRNFGEISPD
jgi:hypothetical protein